jgi:hypothetical protein
MKTIDAIKVLSGISVISIDISSWSGGVTLKREELGVDLPERAFTMGRKYLIAPEKLNPFTTIRRRARDRCLKDGVKFLGGFAVPSSKDVLATLVADLEIMKEEFELKRTELIQGFAQSLEEWCAEDDVKPYEGLIRASIPSISSIESKIEFGFSLFQVAPPQEAAIDSLHKEVEQIGKTLFADISSEANELLDSFMERNKSESKEQWVITTRMIGNIRSLRNKMSGLSIVDGRIIPIVDEIDRVLGIVPNNSNDTKHNGEVMRQMFSVLMILANEKRMLALGEGLSDVKNTLVEFFPVLVNMPLEEEIPESFSQESESESDQDNLDLFDGMISNAVSMPVLDTTYVNISF